MSEAKSYIRTLTNPTGTEKLQFLALIAKEGFSFYITKAVLQEDKKFKIVASGARAKHADLTAAKAAVDAAVKTAQLKGWVAPTSKKGPGPKTDDFSLDNLPTPTAKVEAVTEPEAETSKKSKK